MYIPSSLVPLLLCCRMRVCGLSISHRTESHWREPAASPGPAPAQFVCRSRPQEIFRPSLYTVYVSAQHTSSPSVISHRECQVGTDIGFGLGVILHWLAFKSYCWTNISLLRFKCELNWWQIVDKVLSCHWKKLVNVLYFMYYIPYISVPYLHMYKMCHK